VVTAVGAVLLAGAITALARIAYKHPAAYRVWHPWLQGAAMIAFVGEMVWSLAVIETVGAIGSGCESCDWSEVREIARPLRPPIGAVTVGFIGWTLYLLFLYNLEWLIRLGDGTGGKDAE